MIISQVIVPDFERLAGKFRISDFMFELRFSVAVFFFFFFGYLLVLIIEIRNDICHQDIALKISK